MVEAVEYRTFGYYLHTRAKCPCQPHALNDLLKAGQARSRMRRVTTATLGGVGLNACASSASALAYALGCVALCCSEHLPGEYIIVSLVVVR